VEGCHTSSGPEGRNIVHTFSEARGNWGRKVYILHKVKLTWKYNFQAGGRTEKAFLGVFKIKGPPCGQGEVETLLWTFRGWRRRGGGGLPHI